MEKIEDMKPCAVNPRVRPGEGTAVSAKPRRGFAAGRRLAAAALVALSAMGSFANPTSVAEWYASNDTLEPLKFTRFDLRRYDAETDRIVRETIDPNDLAYYDRSLPDNEIARGVMPRCSGVELVLYANAPVWTLRMSGNAHVDGYEIRANRSFAIELTPGASAKIRAPYPYTNSGKTTNTVYGIYCDYGVLIYGNGTLSVSHNGSRGHGVKASHGDLLITGGASVHVQTDGARAIDAGPSEELGGGGSLSVIGALLETTGGGIWSHGDILFDRAVVNILSLRRTGADDTGGVDAWGDLTIDRSFCTSIAKNGWALYTRKIFWPHDSIVYAMSEKDSCVNVAYNTDHEPSVIEKGLYKFVTLGGDGKSAFQFGFPMTFDGGELVTCAPGGYGMRSVLYDFTMDSGLIRNQRSMNPKNEFVVSRELMEAYGIISGWESLGYETAFDPYDAIAQFLGQTMPDWIEAQGIETPSGDAYAAVATVSFCLNGGTILPEASEMGVIVNNGSGGTYWEPTVKGGSLRGPIGYYDVYAGGYNEMCAVSEHTGTWRADGTPEYSLVCVTNTVAGEPYSHVAGGWTAELPPGYDTSSLYLDGERKLYFWVPEEYVGRVSYTVTFCSEGRALGSVTMKYGKNTNQAAASAYKPTRAGYMFSGWYDKDDNIVFDAQGRAVNGKYWRGAYVPNSSSATWQYAGSVIAYARWTPMYTVTFHGGGKTIGSATMEMGRNTNQAAASAHKPTRAGYTLTGWYDANGNILFNAQGYAVNGKYWNGTYSPGSSSATWKYAGNVTAYAYWTPNKYTVTFYGGGKTLGTATVETGKNTSQAAASAYHPTRAGYTLTGWYDKDGNIVFDAQGRAVNGKYWKGNYTKDGSTGKTLTSAAWQYAGNVTAYAYWEQIQKYTVTFHGGGKTLGSATMEMGRNTNQAAASAHKPTRAGYVLTGWYDKDGNVMFDAQGRATNGKYWNGSYTRSSAGTTLTSATWKYAGSVTAYAYWALAPGTYEVTLYALSGLVSGQDSVTFPVEMGKNTNQAGANRTVTHESHFTDAVYSLVGWYDTYKSSGGNMVFDARGYAVNGKYWNGAYSPNVSSATWKYAGSVTVYARWVSSRTYSVVTFDANGGTIRDGECVSTAKHVNWNITNLVSRTSREGYTLSGWYDKDGNKMFDANGLPVKGIYWEQTSSTRRGEEWWALRWNYTGNVTVYARWTPNANSNTAARKAPSVAVPKDDGGLFAPGELAGRFADGDGTFTLMLDEGLKTAYLAAWTTGGNVLSECEAVVADDTLVLTTESGEVYRLVWTGGSLVARRVE